MTDRVTTGPRTKARRIGRAAGTLTFAILVGGSTGAWTVQILLQVWGAPSSVAPGACRPALIGLIHAVERARQSATRGSGAETARLDRFRAGLGPEWSERDQISARCASDPEARHALTEVDRYRYAEEHAVRYLAGDLAQRRENVRHIEETIGSKSGRAEDEPGPAPR